VEEQNYKRPTHKSIAARWGGTSKHQLCATINLSSGLMNKAKQKLLTSTLEIIVSSSSRLDEHKCPTKCLTVVHNTLTSQILENNKIYLPLTAWANPFHSELILLLDKLPSSQDKLKLINAEKELYQLYEKI
jgi:hypothetical protein